MVNRIDAIRFEGGRRSSGKFTASGRVPSEHQFSTSAEDELERQRVDFGLADHECIFENIFRKKTKFF